MGDTGIQWTDKTLNPLRAENILTGKVGWFCEHVSAGCGDSTGGGCYAEGMNTNTYFGNGLPYKASSLRKTRLFLDEKMLAQPLHWRAPKKVFMCSMTDLFGRFVKNEWIDQVFAMMASCSRHTFQILTKRPERMLEYMKQNSTGGHILHLAAAFHKQRGSDSESGVWPRPNIWLGTSVEDQKTADKRLPLLLQTPAAVRFVSYEPALGPVDIERYLDPAGFQCLDPDCVHRYRPFVDPDKYETVGEHNDPVCLDCGLVGTWTGYEDGIGWVICGGESGSMARPFDLTWARAVARQCNDAAVPCFIKQLGRAPVFTWHDGASAVGLSLGSPTGQVYPVHLVSKKGGDISEFPVDLQIREFPQ